MEFTSHDQLIQKHKFEQCLSCQATPAPIVEQYSTEQGRSLKQLLQTQWAVQQGSRAFQGTALVNIIIVQLGICFEFCTPRSMSQLSTARVQTESLSKDLCTKPDPVGQDQFKQRREKEQKPFRQHLKEDDLLGPC